MANNIPIITTDTALIWATTEMTKAWVGNTKVAPDQIAATFITIYTQITKFYKESLPESGQAKTKFFP